LSILPVFFKAKPSLQAQIVYAKDTQLAGLHLFHTAKSNEMVQQEKLQWPEVGNVARRYFPCDFAALQLCNQAV
jgi:hypothetical protein